MSVLEQLIGKPPHLCTEQELEDWVMQGRLAREAESASAKGGRKKAAGGGKKKQEVPDFDLLDDDDVPEFDLED